MKVALVHDWLIHMRGGEKVLEALAELYPEAVIYTLFYRRETLSPSLQKMKIVPTFLQRVPGIRKFYRWLLPFFPWMIRRLEIEPVDLVISTSHCVAKAVTVPPGARHVSYLHTPMRYLWGFRQAYFGRFPRVLRWGIDKVLDGLRRWDLASNRGVDVFVANSRNVQTRIREFYQRDSRVIYPPLDNEFFRPLGEKKGDYYLVVSAFVPYKRVDIVIEAFNRLERNLIVVGQGPLEDRYRKLRQSNAISFLGGVSGKELRQLYSEALAVVFPTEEDFGIVPCEAQACGTPVIAYRKGGSLETVCAGVFFDEQTPESLIRAVHEFEKKQWDGAAIAAAMGKFSKNRFQREFEALVREVAPEEPSHGAR
ncbi:MAG: glycosyltransferase [Candidatus Omnitrophota bacterium]|jgi:glycosyltransferase involved in cell wall biosynthesis